MDSPPPRGEEGPIDYDDIHSDDIVPINIETHVSDVFKPIFRPLEECTEEVGGGFRLPSGFVVYGQTANEARHNVQVNVPAPLGGTMDPYQVAKLPKLTTQEQYLSVLREVR